MRKHVINLLLLFLIGAAATIVWMETRDPPPEPLIATPQEALQSAAFERDDGYGVALERREDGWWLSRPVETPADPGEANRLLGVAGTAIRERFPVSAVDLAELGLAEPRYRLRFDDTEIVVGGLNPVSRARYLRIGEEVLQIRDPAGLPPPNSHAQLVHKQLLAGVPPLRAIRTPAGMLEYRDGEWQDSSGSLRPEHARRIGQAWQGLRAMWVRALDSDDDDDTAVEVTLTLADGRHIALSAIRDQQLLLQRPDIAAQYHVARNQAALLLNFSEKGSEAAPATTGSGVMAPAR